MSKAVSNVVIATDTFAGWVTKTNVILDHLSNIIVTTDSTAYGANTNGNSSIIGILSANVLSTPVVRGGAAGNTANVSTLTLGFSNATISSNVVVTGYAANITSNTLNITSNTNITSANATANINTYSIYGNTTHGANSLHNLTVSGGKLSVNGTSVNVSSNTTFNGNTFSVASDITASGNSFVISTDNVSFTGANLHIGSDLVNLNANVNATYAISIANTLTVTDNVYLDTDVIFTGNSSALTQATASYDFANTTETTVIDSFPISTYKSAKYTISAKNSANSNVMQLSELNIVHGNTGSNSVHSTEYGIIYSSTKFATYTPGANATHVYIAANSSVSNVAFTVQRTSFK